MRTSVRYWMLSFCALSVSGLAAPQPDLPPEPPSTPVVNPATLPVTAPAPALAPTPVPVAPLAAPAPAPDPATNSSGKIAFATPVYDFGKVRSGEPVKYSFVFTNVGSGTLEVTHVQPSCGCTTAGDWTRKVEPGSNGTIAVQFNSANFNGPVIKTITVLTSDKTAPQTILQLKGTIWKPIDVVPQFAVLNVPPDTGTASAVVRVVNNMEEPITLTDMEVNNRSFSAELKTNTPGKEYQVVVSTVPPLPQGNVQAVVTLKTSNTNMPVVTVNVWANIQPSVVVSPPQLMLPPGPLKARTGHTLMVLNNSTNVMTVSDPSINIPGVTTDVKELQPGKQFSVTLGFPEGFELPPSQPVTFTAKTSNKGMPLIKVAVVQMPRPAQQPVINVNPPPAAGH